MRMSLPLISLLFLFVGVVSLMVWAEDKSVDGESQGQSSEPVDEGSELPDGGDVDGGVGDAGPEESVPAVVPPPPPPAVDESQLAPAEEAERLPYSKGDMEVGIGLGLAGNGNETYLGVDGRFAYYVINRLAPGIDVQYTHIFSEQPYEYPESMTFLPFLKFVITQKKVAPYVFVAGGYAVEWGSDNAVNAWILGLGGGVHIRVAKHFAVNVEIGALHYWYSEKKVYWEKDSDILVIEETGQQVSGPSCRETGDCIPITEGSETTTDGIVLQDAKGNRFLCQDPAHCPALQFKDKKDVKREWYFPLVTIGFSVHF